MSLCGGELAYKLQAEVPDRREVSVLCERPREQRPGEHSGRSTWDHGDGTQAQKQATQSRTDILPSCIGGGERQLDAPGSQSRAAGREREAKQCWGKKVKHGDGGGERVQAGGTMPASVFSFLNMGILTAPSFLSL